MKKYHILLILAMGVSISILISTTGSNSKYGNISDAVESADAELTIIGRVIKAKPIEYNPGLNPNLTTFYMRDKEGAEFKVILNSSKPQDMERSEDVVVKGKYRDDIFYANTILLKCPSKYAEQNQFSQS